MAILHSILVGERRDSAEAEFRVALNVWFVKCRELWSLTFPLQLIVAFGHRTGLERG